VKNIQVIDGADNCTYDLYAATEEEFEEIFPNGTNVEFIEDYFDRVGEKRAIEITGNLWKRLVNKGEAQGCWRRLKIDHPYRLKIDQGELLYSVLYSTGIVDQTELVLPPFWY